MKNALLAGTAAALALAVVAVLWQLGGEPDFPVRADSPVVDTPAAGQRGAPGPADAGEFGRQAEKGRGAGPLPASLDGTEVDGAARVDEHGELIIDVGLRQGFDYFLAAIGEEDLETIKARIAAWLDEELPPGAARQAWAVLERYLGYKEALADIPEHDGTPESMRRTVRARGELRDAWLGQEISDAFYRFENAYDHYMIERMALEQDDSLTGEQRRKRLDGLRAELPDEVRDAMERTRATARVSRQVSELREQGASESEIHALRERELGSEAAQRLSELDQQRAEWDRRYGGYREELEALRERDLDAETLEREIEHLREQHFDEQELRRVETLDRIQE